MLYGAIASSKVRLSIEATALFSGIGNLAASASISESITKQGTATFAGAGQMSAGALVRLSPTALFSGSGLISIDAAIANPTLQGSALFAGAGQMAAEIGKFLTAFSTSLTGSGATPAGYSWRQVVTPMSYGGSLVRVTFKAGSTSYQENNLSVGIQSTNQNTSATPVELKFGGASGFDISANASITSDWATLAFSASDSLVVIGDAGTGGAEAYTQSGVLGCHYYNQASTASYNQANPGGSWSPQLNTCVIEKIEVIGA